MELERLIQGSTKTVIQGLKGYKITIKGKKIAQWRVSMDGILNKDPMKLKNFSIMEKSTE